MTARRGGRWRSQQYDPDRISVGQGRFRRSRVGAPSRIRTCAHGSGSGWTSVRLPARIIVRSGHWSTSGPCDRPYRRLQTIKILVRDSYKVLSAWAEEGCHAFVSWPLPYGLVTVTSQGTCCLADLGGAEYLDSPKTYPQLIQRGFGALDEGIIFHAVLMQSYCDPFCLLSCLDEGNEIRDPFASSAFKDGRRLTTRGCLFGKTLCDDGQAAPDHDAYQRRNYYPNVTNHGYKDLTVLARGNLVHHECPPVALARCLADRARCGHVTGS